MEIGDLKLGDGVFVRGRDEVGYVRNIETTRLVDDENEMVTLQYPNGDLYFIYLPCNDFENFYKIENIKLTQKGENKMKFKVGDKVYVRCGETTRKKYSTNQYMEMLEGTPQTIHSVSPNGFYSIWDNEKRQTWNFAEEDISYKPFSEGIINRKEKKTMDIDIDIERIIFNKPATILYADGERYVTKAHQEEFDAEKGLALALLKAFGISYLDLQRLIKSATVQEKKAPKKKVETKVDKSTPKTEKPKKKCIGRVEKTTEVEKDGSKYTIHIGKRRGVGQKLQFGDSVLVRLCKVYDYEEIETVRELIGRPLKVSYVGESTVMLTLDGKKTYEFARNEVDRISE